MHGCRREHLINIRPLCTDTHALWFEEHTYSRCEAPRYTARRNIRLCHFLIVRDVDACFGGRVVRAELARDLQR